MAVSAPWYESWVHASGSVIIITGAGSGIGLATAVIAAKQGYIVAGWDVSAEGLQRTIDIAGEYGKSIHPIVCDVGSAEGVEQGMQETLKLGRPHMLVNNAGPVTIGRKADFLEMCTAAAAMVHLPSTAFYDTDPAPGASIVNSSSVVGPIVAGGGDWYCSAKAGIAGYTKNEAVRLKGKIRVNAVAPGGPIRTPRNSKFIDEGSFEKILARNPTGRPGSAEELANGIMFLLSPAAQYINGHLLVIDGGLSVAE